MRGGVLCVSVAAAVATLAPGASAGPSPVDDLLARCPTAEEVTTVSAQVPFTFNADPTAGTLVCRAATGSADLTRFQQRAYQALLVMDSMNFRQALPWTSGGGLYDWFVGAVRGVRFRNDIANSFCCDPAYVINVKAPSGSDVQTTRWIDPRGGWGEKGFVEVMVHEARHAEGPAHTCGTNDTSFAEVGAWSVQYYLNLWEALYSGPFLTAPTPYDAYYRDGGLEADQIAQTRICSAPSADLSVSISAAPSPVPRGGLLTYAITVHNGGPGAATEVFLYNTIPRDAFLASTLAGSGSCIGPAGGRNGPVGCSLGSLGPGASTFVQLNLRVTASQSQATVSNREVPFAAGAHVFGTVHDPVSANNSFGVTTPLVNAPPEASTLEPTAVKETSATVQGSVNPRGVDTTYHFEYGRTTAYGAGTQERTAGSGTADVAVSETLTGLPRGRTFHYRLVASSASGSSFGDDATFRTIVRCIVPKVKGRTLRGAKQAIRRAHCAPGRVQRKYSRMRAGRVVSQRPRPGTRLREGGRVSLVLSLGRRLS